MSPGVGGDSPASVRSRGPAQHGRDAPKFDPNASFKFDVKVFTPSWHRGLSETFCDYGMVNIVGEGRNSAVFIVQHKRTQSYFACKMLTKADHEADILRTEIEMMRKLDHPNVVKLYETNEDRDSLFLLMEYCAGGDLFSYISESELGRLSEGTARCFAEQICGALAYCHSNGVVHRDVKPENFLLETEDPGCRTLKLADFGIATSIRRERPTRSTPLDHAKFFEDRSQGISSFSGSFPMGGVNSFVGSPSFPMGSFGGQSGVGSFIGSGLDVGSGLDMSIDDLAGQKESPSEMLGSLPYMAPEMLSNAWKKLVDDAKLLPADGLRMLSAGDMWSTGVVTYVMLSGALPFGTDIAGICSGELPDFAAECWSDVSEDAVDFIKKLLRPRAEDRLMAREALIDGWFRGGSSKGSDGGVQVRDMLPSSYLDPARAPWSGAQTFPESRQELAKKLTESLKAWRTFPKLKRLAIAAVAKRLEPRHPTSWLAQHAYHVFNDTASNLKCERMVQALCDSSKSEQPKVASFLAASSMSAMDDASPGTDKALTDSYLRVDGTQRACSSFTSMGSGGSMGSLGSGTRSFFGRGSSFSSMGSLGSGRSVTGFHVRQRLKNGIQKLARVKEEQPGSPGHDSSSVRLSASPNRFSVEGRGSSASPFSGAEGRNSSASPTGGVDSSPYRLDFDESPSISDMRRLVDALDGMKNGYVDYTLLVAALLPTEVYSEQERIVEVFQLFDLEGQGKISPDNLRRTMNSPDADISRYASMVREFDLDGDGRLDLEEFILMVRGPSFESSPLLDSSARLPDSVRLAGAGTS